MNELTTIEMHQIFGGTLPEIPPQITPSINLTLVLEVLAQQQRKAYLRWLQSLVAN